MPAVAMPAVALMPARSRRCFTTPRHEHAGDYSGGELQLVLRSGAVPAFPACTCGPQLRRPQPCRPQPARLPPSQVLDAPGCAGDAVFFPAAYLRHRVRHLRTGTRRNLVWWAKGKARSHRI